MRIKKINNDKLKVILNLQDLSKKNIDVNSFLSNSIESQDLFFEILDLAELEYDFSIENNKAIIETISLDNNIFVLTITKIKNSCPNPPILHSKIYYFENLDEILSINTFLPKESIYIYKFNNGYYLIVPSIDAKTENILLEYSIPIKNSKITENILIEHGKKII